jgi:hypothetical protein
MLRLWSESEKKGKRGSALVELTQSAGWSGRISMMGLESVLNLKRIFKPLDRSKAILLGPPKERESLLGKFFSEIQ